MAAAVAVPSVVDPAAEASFTTLRSATLEVLGLLAGLSAACGLWCEQRTPRVRTLHIISAAVLSAFVAASIFGWAPAISFLAPGVRHEGTVLTCALAALFFAVSTLDPVQIDILVAAIALGGLGPSLLGIAQTIVTGSPPFVNDPRSPSTFGNAILFGGYLITVVPIAVANAIRVGRQRDVDSGGRPHASLAWWIVAAVEATALACARARGAWIAIAVSAVAVAIALAVRSNTRRWLTASAVALCAVVTLGIATIGNAQHSAVPRLSSTMRVRTLIWSGVARLLRDNPRRLALGYGPEMLQSLVMPFYSPELSTIEGEFAAPDRAHNEVLETLVAAGLVGVAAVVLLHLALWRELAALVRSGSRNAIIATGLLVAAVAHFVDGQGGVATSASRLIWWLSVGIAAAWVAQRDEIEVAPPAAAAPAWSVLAAGLAATVLCVALSPRIEGGLPVGCVIAAAAVVFVWAAAAPTVPRLTPVRRKSIGLAALAASLAVAAAVALTWFPQSDLRLDALTVRATVFELFVVASAAVIGSAIGATTDRRWDVRHGVAALVVVIGAAIVAVWSARPATADEIAHLAADSEQRGLWLDAAQFAERRVELTPYSDAAWSALGAAHLEVARHAGEPQRSAHLARAAQALERARAINGFEWLHWRNGASVERVWAAADPSSRLQHLSSADRFFREASARAPAMPRLWAEWGNVDAERGDIHEALAKLDRAAAMHDTVGARRVADAIFSALRIDLHDPASRARAVAQLEDQGFHALAELYR